MSKVQATTLTIDGRNVAIEGEKNLLELVRKIGIDLPTFCYHSDLSVYGACRLCLVDVEGRGVLGACSTPPEPGLVIRTNTQELREIRKIAIELLLANHDRECTSCVRSGSCQLQDIARRLGITNIRYRSIHQPKPVDTSSPSLIRDPNKCVLCGDCVRFCDEIQSVGAIDFAYRGHDAAVLPAFGQDLGAGECVNCGQCASVCPTGALAPAPEIEAVWQAIHDPNTVVVAQIAPAVRVAIGEQFGGEYGLNTTGQVVAAMKRMGFDIVYDTSFSADLTVVEEANEFIARKTNGERLPLFTSCCPGWVKFAEQYFPQLLGNLSSCRSPQQMLGSMVKHTLPAQLGRERKDIVMVAIMPCTAKKFEARRPEFRTGGVPDVDYVLTTQELARMIEESGLSLNKLNPASFDMPMGFKTGAGVIFGNSGGVTEAVLRYAAGKLTGQNPVDPEFEDIRGEESLRLIRTEVGGVELKLAIVHGLGKAREVMERILAGTLLVDLVEVMACPGGCIGGAGQPVGRDIAQRRKDRTAALYNADRLLDLHCSQENHFVTECYQKYLGEPGSRESHRLLHTHYHHRRRTGAEDIALTKAKESSDGPLIVRVCAGTGCFLRNSQAIIQGLMKHVEANDLDDRVQVQASFCFERCGEGPNVAVGETIISQATLEKVVQAIHAELAQAPDGTVRADAC
ncbi:MAG: [FeFe] hydrogenase, group A [Desulfobulbus sp.]|jgi:NADH-quinone oxidoreductase subunit G|uniref:[FeFe] hydrogenase, group A n=1 Tax=Desulfobulbus sp. TaxID=895 RepID=UPI00283AC0B4|nr:[FeFe] hydrogenase, group A [Desulfobulbus sp.]MDR2551318.1 [FeFe] hydrogenase, group A [Desulfobulbus sp.]